MQYKESLEKNTLFYIIYKIMYTKMEQKNSSISSDSEILDNSALTSKIAQEKLLAEIKENVNIPDSLANKLSMLENSVTENTAEIQKLFIQELWEIQAEKMQAERSEVEKMIETASQKSQERLRADRLQLASEIQSQSENQEVVAKNSENKSFINQVTQAWAWFLESWKTLAQFGWNILKWIPDLVLHPIASAQYMAKQVDWKLSENEIDYKIT